MGCVELPALARKWFTQGRQRGSVRNILMQGACILYGGILHGGVLVVGALGGHRHVHKDSLFLDIALARLSANHGS